jgi:hypothetical protein
MSHRTDETAPSHLLHALGPAQNERMIELLVGLNVIDSAEYARYRAAMRPILEAHQGSFGLDVWVAEVLRSPQGTAFNRLFTLCFPSVERRDAFFLKPGISGSACAPF